MLKNQRLRELFREGFWKGVLSMPVCTRQNQMIGYGFA